MKTSNGWIRRRQVLVHGIAAVSALSILPARPSLAQTPTVDMVIFRPPSLGAFLPILIKNQRFDQKNGIMINFHEMTPDNYNTEFAAGHYPLGGSASLLSEALRNDRGIRTTFLFNLFDFFGIIVSPNGTVRTMQDLKGVKIAGATGTTNYAMFRWFAQANGVNITRSQEINATPAGLSAMAIAGRGDAVELWEPAYSVLLSKKPNIISIPLGLELWEKRFKVKDIPYLGVAAQLEWANSHPELVEKLFRTYEAAAKWMAENPKAAADLVSSSIGDVEPEVLRLLITGPNLRLNVKRPNSIKTGMEAVFTAGMDIKYITQEPPETIYYAN